MKKTLAGDTPSFMPVDRAHFKNPRLGADMGPNEQLALPKQEKGFTTPKMPASTQGPKLPPLSKGRDWNKTRPKGGK